MTTQHAVVTDLRCEKEHSQWLEEITQWKREHLRALEMLNETADFIRRHEAELDDHLREIESHRAHYGTAAEPTPEIRDKHLEVRQRHNIFRGRHRGLMDEVVRLRVELHKAAHGKVFD